MEENRKTEQQPGGFGHWIAIGVGIGTALGAALDNLAVGIALGAAIGAALSFGMGQARRDSHQDEDAQ